MKKKRGFTLVELLGVLVILGVLIAISIPISINVIDASQKKAFSNDVKTIVEAVKLEYETLSLEDSYPCVSEEEYAESTSCNDDSDYRILPKHSFGTNEQGVSAQANGKFGMLRINGDTPAGGSVFLRSTDSIAEMGYFKKYDDESDSTLSVVVRNLVSKDGKWCAKKDYESDNIVVIKSSEDPVNCKVTKMSAKDQNLLAKEIYYNPNSQTVQEKRAAGANIENIDFIKECKKIYNDNNLGYGDSVQCALDVISKSLD